MKSPAASTPPSFLVIRRDNIGDLVLTTPLFAALREKFPTARIAALVNSYNSEVLARNPHLDAVFAYTKASHVPIRARPGAYVRQALTLWRLRRAKFDYAILPNAGFARRALGMARRIGPRHIIGFVGDPPETSSIDTPVPHAGGTGLHEVEDIWRLLGPLGIAGDPPAATLVPDPARFAALLSSSVATTVFQRGTGVSPVMSDQNGRDARSPCFDGAAVACPPACGSPPPSPTGPLVALHISSRKEKQRWPEENFAALARRLRAEHAARFLVFWSPGDESERVHPGDDRKAARLMAMIRDLPAAPMPTKNLADLIAGLSLCDYAVMSDGGAMHIAAALGKPLVCLFGDSSLRHWHPWRVPYEALQKDSRVVRDITPEEVARAYGNLLQRRP